MIKKSLLSFAIVLLMSTLLATEQAQNNSSAQQADTSQQTSQDELSFGDDLSWKFGPGFGLVEAKDYKTEAAFSVNVEMANRLWWGNRDNFQLGISPHLAYVMKGFAFDSDGEKVVQNMHYLELDILSGYVSFSFGKTPLGLNLMFGFPFAFLLDSEFTIDDVTVNNTDRIEVFDLCAYGSVGLEYSLEEYGKITFDIRFESGLLDIFKADNDYTFTTYSVFFNIGYVYNVAVF